MTCIAVVAEYNPFHTGHGYMLRALRAHFGPDAAIAVIMSGSFVQRGEPALFDKWSRASWALSGGADCVVELPALYALSSAEGFASGAVRLAARLGCTHLSCGVEAGTAGEFLRLGKAALSVEVKAKDDKKNGTYGQYVSREIAAMVPKQTADLLTNPNSLLALEYVKALLRFAPSMTFFPIQRRGSTHDASGLGLSYASASALRRALTAKEPVETISPYFLLETLPDLTSLLNSGKYVDYERYDDFVLYQNRFLTPSSLRNFPAFSEGLENRWHRCLAAAASFKDALGALKTRRYAYSRLRRMGAYTALGIAEGDMKRAYEAGPQYARVLAVSPRGAAVLRKAKRAIPVVSKVKAAMKTLTPVGLRMMQYDLLATDIQALCFCSQSYRQGLQDYYTPPVVRK